MGFRTLKKFFWLLVGLLFCGVVTGCATIISGSHQDVKIASTPEGSNFRVEHLTVSGSVPYLEGNTPSTISLNRKHSYLLTLLHQESETVEIPIEYGRSSNWVFGNLIFFPPIGTIIGLYVDAISGASFILEPEEVCVDLGQLPIKRDRDTKSHKLTNKIKKQ